MHTINSDVTINGSLAVGLPLPLDNRTLHATYGDHFATSGLDAKWTRRNITSAEEAYRIRDGSHMRAALWDGSNTRQYHQSAPGSDFEVQVKMIIAGPGQQIVGPMIIDSSGNGVMCTLNTNDNVFVLWTMSAYDLSSNIGTVSERNVAGQAPTGGIAAYGAVPVWYALRKVGTTYSARWSIDGIAWSSYLTGGSAQTFTVNRIGFGRMFNTTINWIDVDWFDVV